MKLLASLVACVTLLGACADNPVSYSAPVGINLKAKSDDVAGGVVSDDKNINTESGNPYGAFVADAQAALGGADPGVLELDGLELLLGGGSSGVTTLGEIFAGTTEVLFVMDGTDNTHVVGAGEITASTGGGPVQLDRSFDSSGYQGDDWDKLLAGGFKVVLRGPAAAGFDTKGADADLQVTFTFAAYE